TRNLLQPLLATALLTGSLLAEAQEYLVELLVFSQPGAQLTPAAGPGMDWDERATALDDTVRGDIRSIDPTRHRLDSDARKLESNGYEIRFHRAWTQPADPHLSVAVREGQPMTDAGGDLLYPVQGLVSLDTDPLSARVTLWLNHATAAEPVSAATMNRGAMRPTSKACNPGSRTLKHDRPCTSNVYKIPWTLLHRRRRPPLPANPSTALFSHTISPNIGQPRLQGCPIVLK